MTQGAKPLHFRLCGILALCLLAVRPGHATPFDDFVMGQPLATTTLGATDSMPVVQGGETRQVFPHSAFMRPDGANAALPTARTNLGLGTASSPVFTGATLTGMTAGSVLFAGASGVLSQDNANLFWDNTNNRLGIGAASPLSPLQIDLPGGSGANNILTFKNFSATDNANNRIGLRPYTDTNQSAINFIGNSLSNFYSSIAFETSPSGTAVEVMRITGDGNVGIGNAIPAVALDVGATAAAMRVRNLFTDISNGEWFEAAWSSNVLNLGTNKNGSGVARAMSIRTGGTAALTISAAQIVTLNAAAYANCTSLSTVSGVLTCVP